MAWGPVLDSDFDFTDAWKADSVQSLVLPPVTPPDYCSASVLRTFDSALPSLTHLHLQSNLSPRD